MKPISYIMQGDNIMMVINNNPINITKSHLNYEIIKECIKTKNWEAIPKLADIKRALVEYVSSTNSGFTFNGSNVLRNGEVLHNNITERILKMFREGFDIQPMMNFVENLYKNPSKRAVDELYGFMEKCALPITDDGCLLAYKKVRDNYFDVYSGTISNHVGATVTMQRNDVDDNSDRTCSSGLHFCSIDYLSKFGGERIVIVKVNPADVVSIPSDYNHSKARCCEYTVVGELGEGVNPDVLLQKPVNNDYSIDKLYRRNSAGFWIDSKGKFVAKNKLPKALQEMD